MSLANTDRTRRLKICVLKCMGEKNSIKQNALLSREKSVCGMSRQQFGVLASKSVGPLPHPDCAHMGSINLPCPHIRGHLFIYKNVAFVLLIGLLSTCHNRFLGFGKKKNKNAAFGKLKVPGWRPKTENSTLLLACIQETGVFLCWRDFLS